MDPSLPEVSVTELRRRFGQILAEVQNGRSFVITRRKCPIAVLTPVGGRMHASAEMTSSSPSE
jgi:prevent-host-death family protein